MPGVNRKTLYIGLVTGILSFLIVQSSFGQGTAFQYQGQLSNGGAPASGDYDLQFTLYNAATNGSAVSQTVTNYNVPVNNGLFTVTLDFGEGEFTGVSLWLDIGVRTNGGGNFTMLSPLQPVLATPYAIFANSASNLVGVLTGSAFTGFTNSVSLTNGANLFAGTFSGNGSAVTNVSVTNLTGVLADSQLPSNTAFLNSNQTFTANNTFTGTSTNTFNGVNTFTNLYGNSFSGSFFGNGLVGWVVVTGLTQQASIDHGYLLTNSQLVTVTLPTLANPGDIIRIACAGASGWKLAQNPNQSVLGNFLSYGTWEQSGAQLENYTSIASSADGSKMAAAFAGSGGDGIFLSINSGRTWGSSGASSSLQWHAIASSADGSKLVAAVTNGGAIYTSTNSGSSFVANTVVGGNWSSVASSADGTKLMAADYGTGLFTNNGTSWTQVFSSGNNDWTAVASSSSGSQFVAAESGVGIWVYTSATKTWKEFTSSLAWQSVASSADGTKMVAVANGNGIYISTNSGTSWPEVSGSPTASSWAGVAISSDGSKLVAANNGGVIYTSSNWGVTWQTGTLAANWSCVASSADGTVLAAGINNALSNGGIYTAQNVVQTITTTVGINGYIAGPQCSSLELQYLGNNQFMPVNSSGMIWAF